MTCTLKHLLLDTEAALGALYSVFTPFWSGDLRIAWRLGRRGVDRCRQSGQAGMALLQPHFCSQEHHEEVDLDLAFSFSSVVLVVS